MILKKKVKIAFWVSENEVQTQSQNGKIILEINELK